MDYEIKANITTILTFLIMPLLAGIGIDAITGAAFVSVLATVVMYVAMYLNEKYLSGIFTKKGYEVVNKDKRYTCNCEEEAINQEYDVEDITNQEYDVEDGA